MTTTPRFSVGERVLDTEADERTTMIVLDPDRGIAADVPITDRDATVADLNPEYPPTDRVVECIHEEWLDRNAGSVWRSWPREAFPERLGEFSREWRLTPRRYDYPESRLDPIDGTDDSSTERDPPPIGQTSMDQWLG